jgi:nitronate monooxygenase
MIVLAPLAGGPSTPELAAAVSNAGGLGFLGAGYLSADGLERLIHATRALTDAPFGVNLFVVEERAVDRDAVDAYLATIDGELGEPRYDDDALESKVALLEQEQVAVVSTTFARPPQAIVDRLRASGAEVWVTVTTPEEAASAEADALVLQGAEAGGHRGSWTDADAPDLTLDELLASVEPRVPLVAAGGIATRDRVREVLAAGATHAQVGTAFLLCPEAGTSEPHRRALAAGGETAVTRAFTGRRARGIVNDFLRAHPDAPSAYPWIHHATARLRAAARAAGDAERINLWAGTAFADARAEPAAEVVARLRA